MFKQHTFGPSFNSKLDLMGIRFVTDPGDGAGAGGDDAAAQAAAAQTATDGAAGAATSTPPWGDDKSKFDPDKAWNLIENLRKDAEKRQEKTDAAIAAAAEKAQKDTLAQFAKLLGGGEQEETDPVKLAAKLQEQNGTITKAQSDLAAAQMSAAVALLAPGLGANASLLLKNEDFKTSIKSAVPTDEAALTSAITKALQANAALKVTPPRSGSGEHQGATVQTLEAQLKTATEKKDWTETIRLKQAIAAARKA